MPIIHPFSLATRLLGYVFRALGIPNPRFNADTVLVAFFGLVCIVAVPWIWIFSSLDVGGRIFSSASPIPLRPR